MPKMESTSINEHKVNKPSILTPSNIFSILQIEKYLYILMLGLFFCSVLISFAGIFFITLGFDEAWILQGIEGIGNSHLTENHVTPTATSGGFFALSNFIIQILSGSTLWAHRALSWLCFLGICWVIINWEEKIKIIPFTAAIPVAMLIGVPGTLLYSGIAYANTHALILFLIAVRLLRTPIPRYYKLIMCGLLTGLAAATRSEYLFGIVGMIIWLALPRKGKPFNFFDASLLAIISTITLLGSFLILRYSSLQPGDVAQLAWSTGVTGYFWDYPSILNKWMIGNSNFILPLAVISSITAYILDRDKKYSESVPCTILVTTGWLIWLAWLTRSPFSHLRYLWPSLVLFTIVIGFGLARLRSWGIENQNPVARIAPLLIVLAFSLSGIGAATRTLLHGESNTLISESSGYIGLDYFRRFQHIQDQWKAVEYIKRTYDPRYPTGIIGTDRELNYLTGRPLKIMIEYSKDSMASDNKPKQILVPPGGYYYLSTTGKEWIENNCTLDIQFGQYSFYTVTGSYPQLPVAFARGGYSDIVHPLSAITAGTIND